MNVCGNFTQLSDLYFKQEGKVPLNEKLALICQNKTKRIKHYTALDLCYEKREFWTPALSHNHKTVKITEYSKLKETD